MKRENSGFSLFIYEYLNTVNKVIFSNSISKDLEEEIQRLSPSKIFWICDENSQQHCLPLLSGFNLEQDLLYVASPGENHKNLSTCEMIWAKMTEAQLDRKALVINIGGGVITDMGGFASSIYKRGVRFINIPTTLLSQVDASVGGKLGIDFRGFKNHLGVFNEPESVLISSDFLATLPKRELRSGFAEVMKHGLIRDRNYFENLDLDHWESSDWKNLIEHSVKIKSDVVLEDPKESGLRKILNFGHTIGHALETYHLDGPNHLLHGEAIAIGMICEAYLSSQKIGLSQEDLKVISEGFLKVYGHHRIENSALDEILDLCVQDKKNEGKVLLFSLLNKIGDCTFNIPVERDEIRKALEFYQNLAS